MFGEKLCMLLNFDKSEIRSDMLGKVWSVVLKKDAEYHLT